MGQDEDRLRREIEAYHASALAYAAVKLGLADKMGSQDWSAEALAAKLGLSPPHLFRLLRGLVTLGICEERAGGKFALTRLGDSLKLGSPSRLGEKVMIVVEQYWRPWADLISTVRTGTPAFDQAFGMSVLEWRRANPEAGALYSLYLAEENFAQAADVVEAINFAGVKTVAQIAGGYGGLLAAVLRLSHSLVGRGLARAYLELIRNTPLLVQLYLFYFVAAPLFGLERFWAGVLCLAVFEGAFATEIFRAGIEAVPKGQWEAANALGLQPSRLCGRRRGPCNRRLLDVRAIAPCVGRR